MTAILPKCGTKRAARGSAGDTTGLARGVQLTPVGIILYGILLFGTQHDAAALLDMPLFDVHCTVCSLPLSRGALLGLDACPLPWRLGALHCGRCRVRVCL